MNTVLERLEALAGIAMPFVVAFSIFYTFDLFGRVIQHQNQFIAESILVAGKSDIEAQNMAIIRSILGKTHPLNCAPDVDYQFNIVYDEGKVSTVSIFCSE